MDIQQMAETKSSLQMAWRTQWHKHGKKGTLAGATGIGKTKPAIDEMMDLWNQYQTCLADESFLTHGPPRIFLAVPTEKLRDEGWPEEVREWYGDEGMEMWKACVQAECYISMHKVMGKAFDLVILDEVHKLTALSFQFFKYNTCIAIMGLTATAPDKQRDPDKYEILKDIAPVVFTYSLDQGVADGVVADFEINVIMMPLDDKDKCIPAGTKDKPFLTTEHGQYEFLSKKMKQLFVQKNIPGASNIDQRIMYATMNRSRFIYNLPSKTKLAARVMAQILPDKRTIIFCGGIAQSRMLCGEHVFNSKDKTNGKFEEFKAGRGQFLGVVNAANEGHNIKDLDQALIVQVNSNERDLVQRIGRTVRAREDHKAVVWILCAQGTVDEKWVEKSLANFDKTKIRYWSHKEFD